MKCVIAIAKKLGASVIIGLGAGLLAGGLTHLVENCVCIVCKNSLYVDHAGGQIGLGVFLLTAAITFLRLPCCKHPDQPCAEKHKCTTEPTSSTEPPA